MEYFYTEECKTAIDNIKEKIALMPKLKQQGFSSYGEYEEYKAYEKARQSFYNLRKYLGVGSFANTIPLKNGDIIEVPKYGIDLINGEITDAGYLYLFTTHGADSRFANYAFLISSYKIPTITNMILEPIKIQCQGTTTYKRGQSKRCGAGIGEAVE